MKNRWNLRVSIGPVLVLAGASLAVGCGDSGSDGGSYDFAPEVDCSAVTPKGFAQLKPIFDKCTTCHSVTLTGLARSAAPVGTDYDDYAGAKEEYVEIADRVFDTASPMPPNDGKSAQLTDAEKADLNAWSQCGTPQ